MTGRVPPHNLEAEEALLGAMLLSKEAIDIATEAVTADDYYKPAHGLIHQTILNLHSVGEPVDTVTVANDLKIDKQLDLIGGPAALVALQSGTPATSSARRYAKIVAEDALLRRLIGAGAEIVEAAFTGGDDVAKIVDQAEELLHAVTDLRSRSNVIEHVEQVVTRILHRIDDPPDVDELGVLNCGWVGLDDLLAGFRPGQLIVIGARPAMGKSALAGNLAVAVAHQAPVVIASLEMTNDELTMRLLAAEGKIALDRLRKNTLTGDDRRRLTDGAKVGQLPIWFHDNAGATLLSIAAAVRRTQRAAGRPPRLLIVDYVQLVSVPEAKENRQVEVATVARGLKRIARQHDLTVVALAQLNRSLEHRADKRPTLADLRESGELEQASDAVVFLYRDEVYHPQTTDLNVAELIVAKQRSGPTGTVRLDYTAYNGRFTNQETF